jgi:hypothetical protein
VADQRRPERGRPETNVVVLGTALHRECIVYQLQRTPGWETHAFR